MSNVRIAAAVAVTFIAASTIVMVSAEDAGGTRTLAPVSDPVGEQATLAPKPPPRALPAPVRPRQHTSRQGVRKPVKPAPPVRASKPRPRPQPTRAPGITITSYAWCPGSAQSCIDAGRLTGYNQKYLAGHNYRGYQWLSRVAVGTTVRVTSGPLTGTYRVYGHLRLNRQGGSFPDTGGADLVLQSCESNGTGFSLARRV
jgi:hypothetical protein